MYSSGSNGSVMISENKYHREEKKQKKLGWFTRWFDRKCRESWERARDSDLTSAASFISPSKNSLDSSGLRLTIYGADGGTVLEFNHYDIKTDRHNNSLHVISHSDNFEERVAQAITMEMLRRGMGN